MTTVDVEPGATVAPRLTPTLFPAELAGLTEITSAMARVTVDALSAGNEIIHDETVTIRLLPRTSAPMALRDAVTDEWIDLSRYLGAYVTDNDPDVRAVLARAAGFHHEKRLRGYQDEVESQARAIYDFLKTAVVITYVDSIIDTPDPWVKRQRIRLPCESLKHGAANCIDGTLLFASLLQAISINPAIVLIPGHALVGWETGKANNDWQYLETTAFQTHDFDGARQLGNRRAASYAGKREADGNPAWFRRWSLRELRADGITAMSEHHDPVAGEVKALGDKLDTITDLITAGQTAKAYKPAGRPLYGVGELPPHYVPRAEEMTRLRAALNTDGDGVAITALEGMGGVGKSTLARAFATDAACVQRYPDGVLWGQLGPETESAADADRVLLGWGVALGLAEIMVKLPDATAKAAFLQQQLGDRKFLLIIDDIWHGEPARLLMGGARSQLWIAGHHPQTGTLGRAAHGVIAAGYAD